MIALPPTKPAVQDSNKLSQVVSYRLGKLVPHPAIIRLGLARRTIAARIAVDGQR
jgi:hypothetical protein